MKPIKKATVAAAAGVKAIMEESYLIPSQESTRNSGDITQQSKLEGLERVIESGLQTFIEVGSALKEIRDLKLYRESHKSFEEYCRERWGMGKAYAHRLIGASEVVGNLSPMGDIPKSERQCRPLTNLEPEQQQEAWAGACKEADSEGRKVTAADVHRKVKESRTSQDSTPSVETPAEPQANKIRDSVGNPIPDKLQNDYIAITESVSHLLSDLRRLKKQVNDRFKNDSLWQRLNKSAFDINYDNLRDTIDILKPYTICPYCSGEGCLQGPCKVCRDVGWLCKLEYDRMPEGLRWS